MLISKQREQAWLNYLNVISTFPKPTFISQVMQMYVQVIMIWSAFAFSVQIISN